MSIPANAWTLEELHRLPDNGPRSVIRFEGSEAEPDLMVRPAAPEVRGNDWERLPPLLVIEALSPGTFE
jgi:Uma2 family endonuclease